MTNPLFITGYENHHKQYCFGSDEYDIYLLSKNIHEDWESIDGDEEGILRHHLNSNNLELISFKHVAHVISKNFSQNLLFYGNFEWKESVMCCKIYKINSLEQEILTTEVFSFKVEDDLHEDIRNSCLWSIQLHIINERYMCVSIPYVSNPEEIRRFSSIERFLLIDLLEQVSYPIPDKIGDSDSILRLDSLHTFKNNQQNSIVITTGRITSHEKERLWIKEYNNKNYYLQSVVVIDVDDFICLVKNGLPINESYIIEQALLSDAIANLSEDNNMLGIHKHCFLTQHSKVAFYDMTTKKYESFPLQSKFDYIFMLNNRSYGRQKTGKQEAEIVDIHNNSTIAYIQPFKYLIQMKHNILISVNDTNHIRVYNLLDCIEILNFALKSDQTSVLYNHSINTIVCIE